MDGIQTELFSYFVLVFLFIFLVNLGYFRLFCIQYLITCGHAITLRILMLQELNHIVKTFFFKYLKFEVADDLIYTVPVDTKWMNS